MSGRYIGLVLSLLIGAGVGRLSTWAGKLSQLLGLLFCTEVPGIGLPVSSLAHQQ